MPHKSPFGSYDLPPDGEALSADEQEILYKISEFIVRRGFTVPAILTLESVKPLNYIGSQAMVFLEPFVHALFKDISKYNTLRRMMEKRDNVERLLQKIEELDAVQFQKEKDLKKKYKAEKKARWAKRKRFLRKLLGREKPEDSSSIRKDEIVK
jgi:hypothetical protein